MTRSYLFVIGPGRSGTTLLSHLLNQSPEVFIAPETKFFLHIWAQRFWLRLLPRRIRLRAMSERLVDSEYPRDLPTFPPHQRAFERILDETPDLAAAFPRVLRELSDRPVLGEKTPWHTFFAAPMAAAVPEARFVAVIRDAPATVASTWKRAGFRRVDTIAQCTARWIHMSREILRLRTVLSERLLILRFEDLVTDPSASMERVAAFARIGLTAEMTRPTHQDSSFRSASDPGMDRGAVDRWRGVLTAEQLRLVRGLTWKVSRELGYPTDPEPVGGKERLAVRYELTLLGLMTALMRAGLYPFGAVWNAMRPS